jgi:hypothetical protein
MFAEFFLWLAGILSDILPFGKPLLKLCCVVVDKLFGGSNYYSAIASPTLQEVFFDFMQLIISIPLMILLKEVFLWDKYRKTSVQQKFRRAFMRIFVAPVLTAILSSVILELLVKHLLSQAGNVWHVVGYVAAAALGLGFLGFLVVLVVSYIGLKGLLRFTLVKIIPAILEMLFNFLIPMLILVGLASHQMAQFAPIIIIFIGLYIMMSAVVGKKGQASMRDNYSAVGPRKRKLPFILGLD